MLERMHPRSAFSFPYFCYIECVQLCLIRISVAGMKVAGLVLAVAQSERLSAWRM